MPGLVGHALDVEVDICVWSMMLKGVMMLKMSLYLNRAQKSHDVYATPTAIPRL